MYVKSLFMPRLNTELIGSIYDASLDSTQWQSVMNSISNLYHASVGVLMCHDHFYPAHDIHIHVRNPEDIQQLYQQEYFLDGDLWYQIAKRNWPAQTVTLGEEHISDTQLRKTDFYNDILKPADCGQQLSGSISADSRSTKAIALSRPFNSKRFSQEDKNSMRDLVGHLRRAFSIHEKISSTEKQQKLIERLFSMTTMAAMVCSTTGKIVFSNELADNILCEGNGLQVSGAQLICDDRIANDALQAALKNIDGNGSAVIKVEKTGSADFYQVMVFLIDNRKYDINGNEVLAGVFISSTRQDARPDAKLLQELYNLTNAEVSTAQLLYMGLSPVELARHKQVKVSTVRTQLHRIFEKTNTRNQAQLVRLIAENIAWHRV